MKTKNAYTLLDDAAGDQIPQNVDLRRRIQMKIRKEKSPMNTRFKLAAIAFTLMFLAAAVFSTPDVARSMQKLFGFIPGVGLVDQSVPIRRLPEPVSQTQDGITIRITEAVLDAERTTVHFAVENIPSSAYPQHLPGSDLQGFQNACSEPPYLRLPDGTWVEIGPYNAISGNVEVPAYEASFTLGAVPAGVDEAILVVPCILGVEHGAAPESWEFHLSFSGGDVPSMVPVVDLQAPAAPGIPEPPSAVSAVAGQEQLPGLGIYLVLDKMVPLPSGDILYGNLVWDENTPYSSVVPDQYVLTDGNGERIPLTQVSPDPSMMPAYGERRVPVAFKIMGTASNTGPLTLSITKVAVNIYLNDVHLTLDTGLNPTPGQSWLVNQEINAGGTPIQLNSVLHTYDGYEFLFQPAEKIACIDVIISRLSAASVECGQGLTRLRYNGVPPTGPMDIQITNLATYLDGNWQVTWEQQK